MNSKDLIKWGLIAVGVYLVYEYIQAHGGLSGVLGTGTGTTPATIPPPGTTTGTQPPVTPPTTQPPVTTPPPPPPPAGPDTRQKVLNAAVAALGTSRGNPPMLTTDEWSYYYSQVTGQAAPAGIWPTAPADAIYQANSNQAEVSIDDWWGPMQAAGISGLGFYYQTPSWYM